MRKLLALAGFILLTTGLALAEPAAPVSPPQPSFSAVLAQSDLASLREVCGLAQKSASLTLEQSTSVGSYCLDLLGRLGRALSTKPESPAPQSAPSSKLPSEEVPK